MNERRKAFTDFSAEDKANIFKFHLAFQLAKRQSLTKDQKDVILEGISLASSESYDKNNPAKQIQAQQDADLLGQKAMSLFSKNEGSEIFGSLGGNKDDIAMLQKYQTISKLYSLAEKKELFSNSSSVEKGNYWKLHLANSFVEFPDLNSEQKEIIVDLISMITPKLYDIEKNSKEWQSNFERPFNIISDRILTTFSREIGPKIFLNLGSYVSTSPKDDVPTLLRPAACTCSQGSIPACWDEYCVNTACNRGGHCGVLWLFECNGAC